MGVIEKTFRPIYEQPCWGVHYHRQLNLSMNFGKPSLRIREPLKTDSASDKVKRLLARRNVTIKGEWWLWIYCSFWRLTFENDELAKDSSSIKRIEKAILQLDGQKLISIDVSSKTGATRFDFDLGCHLHCRRRERDTDDELWTLYKPSGYVLSVHGNGTYCHQRGTDVGKHLQPLENGVF